MSKENRSRASLISAPPFSKISLNTLHGGWRRRMPPSMPRATPPIRKYTERKSICMQFRGFVSFSSAFMFRWKRLEAVSCVALCCAASLTAQQAQKPYKGAGGKAEVPGVRVPFQAGPLDESGHPYQVIPPQSVISVPLHMTDETLKAKQAATSGTAVPSTKPLARELTPAQSSAFHASEAKIKSFNLQRAGQAQAVSPPPGPAARTGPVPQRTNL